MRNYLENRIRSLSRFLGFNKVKKNSVLKVNSVSQKNKNLKTFCPLPWTHISASLNGQARICCEGYELLTDSQNQALLWKNSKNLHSFFNTKDYKKIRLEMLKGKRPSHCKHCFNQEDHGVRSMRLQFIDQYQSEIEKMRDSTNPDGSIDKPEISYIDMALGNHCNLKCRMCSPWSSYIIGKDWQKLGKAYNQNSAKQIFKDKWYAHPNTLNMLKEALPHTKAIFTTGGEPLLIKEHLKILEMIIEEGYADQILLRYNSNQTVIPSKITELWKHFKTITFNCSVEAIGPLNNYIRYPSQWEKLEKNIYFLDNLSYENKNIEIYIHSTLQAYNVIKLPDLLNYLRKANFKSIGRFPFFIWVRIPKWLSPTIFPKKLRHKIANNILQSIKEHEDFFLNYNPEHKQWSQERISILKEFCEMIKNDDTQEEYLPQFIEETKRHDRLRKQSVLDVLPELKSFFSS